MATSNATGVRCQEQSQLWRIVSRDRGGRETRSVRSLSPYSAIGCRQWWALSRYSEIIV
jgi:hypothetical protein